MPRVSCTPRLPTYPTERAVSLKISRSTPKFHWIAYGVLRLNSVVQRVGDWLTAAWSSSVRGTLKVGVATVKIPPLLTVPLRSSTVTAEDNPALPPTALLITVTLLSIA